MKILTEETKIMKGTGAGATMSFEQRKIYPTLIKNLEEAPSEDGQEGLLGSEAEFSGEGNEDPSEKEVIHGDSSLEDSEADLDPRGHMLTSQGRPKSLKCKMCPYRSNEMGNLASHIRIHTKEKPFQCETCSLSFSKKFNLIRHQLIHTGEQPFKCNFCSYSSGHRSQLTRHTRTHTGEKPFTCKLCLISFTNDATLRIHIKVHTGEKPFKCEICSYAFSRKSNLASHMLTHTGKRPFKCKLCAKLFSRRENLFRHIRTHTGERPFKCEMCSLTFARSNLLRTHKANHAVTAFKNISNQNPLPEPQNLAACRPKPVQTSPKRLPEAETQPNTSLSDASTTLVDKSSPWGGDSKNMPDEMPMQMETPTPRTENGDGNYYVLRSNGSGETSSGAKRSSLPSNISGSRIQANMLTPPRRRNYSSVSPPVRSIASSSGLESRLPSTIAGSMIQDWLPTPPQRPDRSHGSQSIQSNASNTSSLRTNASSLPATVVRSKNQTLSNRRIPTPPRGSGTTFVVNENLPADNQILELKLTQSTAPYPCPLCTTRAYSLVSYRRHARKHLFSRRFTCVEPNCEYSSPSFAPFKSHCESKHGTVPVLGMDSLAMLEAVTQRIQELII